MDEDLKNKIISFIERNSTQRYEEGNSRENCLYFATRENGNCLDEEYSDIDFNEALSLEKKLITYLDLCKVSEYKISIEPIDEWVIFEVTLN